MDSNGLDIVENKRSKIGPETRGANWMAKLSAPGSLAGHSGRITELGGGVVIVSMLTLLLGVDIR
jgi:hypothetical protein